MIIAGPCQHESLEQSLQIIRVCYAVCKIYSIPYVFKASFDKANRTSISSYRGPGMEKGLQILAAIGRELGVPVITDVHEPGQAAAVAEVNANASAFNGKWVLIGGENSGFARDGRRPGGEFSDSQLLPPIAPGRFTTLPAPRGTRRN